MVSNVEDEKCIIVSCGAVATYVTGGNGSLCKMDRRELEIAYKALLSYHFILHFLVSLRDCISKTIVAKPAHIDINVSSLCSTQWMQDWLSPTSSVAPSRIHAIVIIGPALGFAVCKPNLWSPTGPRIGDILLIWIVKDHLFPNLAHVRCCTSKKWLWLGTIALKIMCWVSISLSPYHSLLGVLENISHQVCNFMSIWSETRGNAAIWAGRIAPLILSLLKYDGFSQKVGINGWYGSSKLDQMMVEL